MILKKEKIEFTLDISTLGLAPYFVTSKTPSLDWVWPLETKNNIKNNRATKLKVVHILLFFYVYYLFFPTFWIVCFFWKKIFLYVVIAIKVFILKGRNPTALKFPYN